jgi:hypothetical protein
VRTRLLGLVEKQPIGRHRKDKSKRNDRPYRDAAQQPEPQRQSRRMLDGRKIKSCAREHAGAEQGEKFQHVFMAGFKHKSPERRKGANEFEDEKELEARGGIEPPIKVLQTYALPLGDRADCLWQERIITSEARGNVPKIRTRLIC